MRPIRLGTFLAIATVLAPAQVAAREPLPQHLDCTATTKANWIVQPLSTAPYPEDRDYIVHLDTRSGEWFLANLHSAAMTDDSGRFDILRDGTGYPAQWLGLDDNGATQLRIDLYQPVLPFLFLDDDHMLLSGTCAEPEEPFLFLR